MLEQVTDLSRVSLACYEDVTRMLRESYEETAPVEFGLHRLTCNQYNDLKCWTTSTIANVSQYISTAYNHSLASLMLKFHRFDLLWSCCCRLVHVTRMPRVIY